MQQFSIESSEAKNSAAEIFDL